jgi:two-component system, cell cycle sensor histidine kinase and response regulator CckA
MDAQHCSEPPPTAVRSTSVLTDVVMRGMSGPELASRFMDSYPEAKFLYMSGYTGEFVVTHRLSESIPLLEKPFTRAALLRAIQTALQIR